MIVVGQSLRVTLYIDTNITGASNVQIGHLWPGGSKAYWTAVVDDAVNGQIHYDAPASENTAAGTLTVWPKVTQSDGKVIIAPAQSIQIVAEGSVS
jgi:hypothetical protein